MVIGTLTLQLDIPGCKSLKNKRSRLKPLLSRLHREFNISVAEVDHHDSWQSAVIACVMISNSPKHIQRTLQGIEDWVECNWPDVTVIDDSIEI